MSTVKHDIIRQRSFDQWALRDVALLTTTHKGYEAVVLSQATPDATQLVEVEIDRHKLGELIEALQSLQSFLSPHAYTPRASGSAGSLEL